MVSPTSRVRSTLVAALACVAALAFAAPAAATAEEDPRATVHEGNATTCADADLAGERVAVWDDEEKDVDSLEIADGDPGADHQYLDILAVDEGITVTGIVVKGSPRWNRYVPGELELAEAPEWLDLRAPLNDGHAIPAISHWFVCGIVAPPTTTATTTTTTATTTQPPATTTTTAVTEPPVISTTESTPGAATTTGTATSATTSAAVAPPIERTGGSGPLADTGFGGAPLLWAGLLSIIAGAGALMFARRRRTS